MLKAKKGFENTIIEYRVGQANIKIKVCDITHDHIEKAKYYCDLSAYVEEVQIVSEHEVIEIPKRTRKKK